MRNHKLNTLTVFKFGSPGGAQEMLNNVYKMQNQELITVVDAATVSWPEDRKAPKTKQAVNLTGAGAMDGAFWGMIFASWTTLMYLLVAPGGVRLFDWVWLGLAILVDLGTYAGGGYGNRDRIRQYTG